MKIPVWAILWSFFCYSLLLDFGFGLIARKCTSTELYRADIDRYNRTISTVFSFHVLMSLLIPVGTGIAVFFVSVLLHAEQASSEQPAYYRTCFLCFGIGSALVFPFGIFPDILVGLQRIYLRNYVNIVSKLIELAGVLIIFRLGGGLITSILFTVALMALTRLFMLFFAFRLIPGFHLRFRVRPDPELFREIFHFRGFVYLISMARPPGAIAVAASALCVQAGRVGGVVLPRFLVWTGIKAFALLRDALLRPLAEISYCSGRLSDFGLVALAGEIAAVLYPVASFFLVTDRNERAKIRKTVYTYLSTIQS